MTSSLGVWEHALYSEPRQEHGLCTDDNARALILLVRQPQPMPDLQDLVDTYLTFVQDAALPYGGFHNRRLADGTWADLVGSDDSQGRAIWALGNVVRNVPELMTRTSALTIFECQEFASPSPRANAFAILGAADVSAAIPDHPSARERLRNWASGMPKHHGDKWPWPEPRLAYDNARIPEAFIAAGLALSDEVMIDRGIQLLEWLVSVETANDHFSFSPVGGWAPGEPRPGFDQQPVEAAAFADACARAWEVTGDDKWRDLVLRAARWFLGENDLGAVLYDPETGGGYDGLTSTGPNLNQGAESTIAALSALQQAARVDSTS